jgi:PAS domain-containing protein
VEDALAYLYRFPRREQREELLGLIHGIMRQDQSISQLFRSTAYTVCDRHLVITFVNDVFLDRSKVDAEELIGKSLYYEREYEGTQIEQLYSMVMETRLMADALVRYVTPRMWSGTEHDGWFAIVVVPLEEGGIGVLSRFAATKEELASEIDPNSPEAPRLITVQQQPSAD